MRARVLWSVVAATLLVGGGGRVEGQQPGPGPQKLTVEGVRNFTRLDATMGCAGATQVSAVPELKRMGFTSIVNLRLASEEGAGIEAERAAAESAGLKFFHLPYNPPPDMPEEEARRAIDAFLRIVGDPANQPVLVHCSGGGRSASLWMIKRVVLDGWDVPRARAEAEIAYPGPVRTAADWSEAYLRSRTAVK